MEVSQSASKQMEADLPLTSPKTNTIDPATDEAETWVMAVTGLKKPDEMELQAWLKSGVVLCNLANCLKPHSQPPRFRVLVSARSAACHLTSWPPNIQC